MGFPEGGWVALGSDTGTRGLRACPSPTRMLQTLKELEACSSEAKAKATAFQHLLLLVGVHLFKVRHLDRRGDGRGVGARRLPPEQLEGFAGEGSGELNF